MTNDEAMKDNELPSEVQLNQPIDTSEYTKENDIAKDKIAEFGFTDLQQFEAKMTSDAVFAKKVTRKFLGLDQDVPFRTDNTSGARQEHNITGVLVHTEYPPKVANATPEASKEGITPVIPTGTTGTTSTPVPSTDTPVEAA